jgi:hypothetical protein
VLAITISPVSKDGASLEQEVAIMCEIAVNSYAFFMFGPFVDDFLPGNNRI